MTICPDDAYWTVCGEQVKAAINSSQTVGEAVEAANRWAARFRLLYAQNPSSEWAPSDTDRFEDAIADKINDDLGKWVDPAQVALTLALSKYFPTLSAALELASAPIVSAIWVLLAPSPIANAFTEAKDTNDQIESLLRSRLDAYLHPGWQQNYDEAVQQAFVETKGPSPKP